MQKGDNAMYNINFYKDEKGNEPVKEYIISLKAKNTKDSLIKLQKIQDYLNVLKANGTRAGLPYVRHLDGTATVKRQNIILRL